MRLFAAEQYHLCLPNFCDDVPEKVASLLGLPYMYYDSLCYSSEAFWIVKSESRVVLAKGESDQGVLHYGIREWTALWTCHTTWPLDLQCTPTFVAIRFKC